MTMSTALNSNETLDLVRKALGAPGSLDELRKAGITVSTGLVYFDLRTPARSLYPVLTPLRNSIPRRQGRGGTAVNWRALTGINTTTLPAGVSEGNRNAVMSVTEANYVRAYAGLGMENYASFEADYAAENFDDVKAKAALTALQALMIAEEYEILGGNTSFALGTTPTPTLITSTTGGSIAATTTVSVICVALTPDGYRYASLAAGIKQTIARTNADGSTDTINGGTAQASTNATIATGAGSTNSVSASVAVVAGAAAYAWYVGLAGSEKISAITTLNSVLITALPGSGQTAASLTATDFSKDGLMFDGLLTYGYNQSVNLGYFASQATGTPGTGTPLTTDGAGGILELNTMFQYYWNTWRLSPDEIWVHAQEQQNITKKIIANGGAPLIRLTTTATTGAEDISGGARVSEVINPITGQKVPLRVHPFMPAGTLLARVKQLPPGTYPNSQVADTVEIETRRDYYQLEWPLRSRKYEYGVYVDETPVVWAPFVMGVINNIANG